MENKRYKIEKIEKDIKEDISNRGFFGPQVLLGLMGVLYNLLNKPSSSFLSVIDLLYFITSVFLYSAYNTKIKKEKETLASLRHEELVELLAEKKLIKEF